MFLLRVEHCVDLIEAIAIHYFRCVTHMDDSKVWHILFFKSFLRIFLQGMWF